MYNRRGGMRNVGPNANLTSQGIQHRDTKWLPIQTLTKPNGASVIKWEPVFSLGQAVQIAANQSKHYELPVI